VSCICEIKKTDFIERSENVITHFVINIVYVIITLYVSILTHEAGHAIMAISITKAPSVIVLGSDTDKPMLKIRVGKIFLFLNNFMPAGFHINRDCEILSERNRIATSLAGPFSNLLQSIILIPFLINTMLQKGLYYVMFISYGWSFVLIFVMFNFLVFVINIYPSRNNGHFSDGFVAFNQNEVNEVNRSINKLLIEKYVK